MGKRQVKSSFALQNLVSLTPTPVERTGKVAPVYQYNEQLEYVSYTKGELRVMLSRSRIEQMTVESNSVIAIATLSDWLERLAPVFQPMRS